jgi:hypothetical protein
MNKQCKKNYAQLLHPGDSHKNKKAASNKCGFIVFLGDD